MTTQLIPQKLLDKSDKVLFVTHLAIGDFTYLQTYFKLFADKYPHIKVDIWIDEGRRTWRFWRWKNLSNYSLYDWVESCPFFNKVYKETYSPTGFQKAQRDALDEEYPLVISLATLRPFRYAQLARSLAPAGFVAGMRHPLKAGRWFKQRMYAQLDAQLCVDPAKDYPGRHINEVFASWFEQLCGLTTTKEQQAPFVSVPAQWLDKAKKEVASDKNEQRLIFINSFAKDKKRCWTTEHVMNLIKKIKDMGGNQSAQFIVNAIPPAYDAIREAVKESGLQGVTVFTASESFFQLPAIIACCDLVISVETSTIHLASALGVPVVALMRQKNPEWAPWRGDISKIITVQNRSDWIKDLPVDEVFTGSQDFITR